MKNTKWNFKKVNNAEIAKNNELPLDKDILSILYSRNISNKKDIIEFLNPSLSNIQDHHLLKDLKKSVDIIFDAMKNKKNILVSLVSLSVLMIATQTVHADSANFSVTPKIGENQVVQNLGYFNLLLKPKQTQNVEFTLNNNSNQTIKVKTTFGTAFTSQSGNVGYTPDLVKPDPSLKINLKYHSNSL